MTGKHAAGRSVIDEVLHGTAWLGFEAVIRTLLQIGIFAVLARLLSPSEFGAVAVATIFVELATGFAAVGTGQALVQRRELTSDHVRAALWISIIAGLSTTGVVVLLAPTLAALLSSADSAPMISALAATLVLGAVTAVPEGLVARQRRFKVLALRKLLAYTTGYGLVGIGSAVAGYGAWSLVFAQLTQTVISVIVMLAVTPLNWRPSLRGHAYLDILGFGGAFGGAQLINTLANQTDRAIVSMNFGNAAIGLYTRALQLMRYPTVLVGQVIEDVLFPSFAALRADDLARAHSRAVGATFVVMLPTAAVLAFAATPLTATLLGPGWDEAAVLVVVFAVTVPFRSAQRVCVSTLRVLGRHWVVTAQQVLLLMTTVLGSLCGVKFGLVGAATGVTLGYILHYVALVISCSVLLGVGPSHIARQHLPGIPMAMLCAFAAWGASQLVPGPAPLTLLLALLGAGAAGVVGLLVLPRVFLGSDGKWLVSLIVHRLPVTDTNRPVRVARGILQRWGDS